MLIHRSAPRLIEKHITRADKKTSAMHSTKKSDHIAIHYILYHLLMQGKIDSYLYELSYYFVALVFLLSNFKFCDISKSNKSPGNGLQIKKCDI